MIHSTIVAFGHVEEWKQRFVSWPRIIADRFPVERKTPDTFRRTIFGEEDVAEQFLCHSRVPIRSQRGIDRSIIEQSQRGALDTFDRTGRVAILIANG